MNTKQKTNGWVDLALFTGFIATFFLDLTGVEIHQWIGIFGGALASYHLLIHREWVEAVSQRFFASPSGRSRLYYIVDAALLIGFTLIVATGLVISTWFNLSLVNYAAWLSVHIIVSISTLLALLVKLGLHWRWIARTAQNALAQPVAVPNRAMAAQPVKVNPSRLSRREFLQVMGVVGTASFLALASASKSLASLEEAAAGATNIDTTTQTDQTVTMTSGTGLSGLPQSSSSGCAVQCGKRCAYLGHCRRYVDSNNNNRCDLGECL